MLGAVRRAFRLAARDSAADLDGAAGAFTTDEVCGDEDMRQYRDYPPQSDDERVLTEQVKSGGAYWIPFPGGPSGVGPHTLSVAVGISESELSSESE